jgi:dihydrofolate reductase
VACHFRAAATLLIIVTVDGYHETTDGELFWDSFDDEFHEFALAQIDAADTLLFGRKTYQGMAEFWCSPAALEADPEKTKRMNRLPRIVASVGSGNVLLTYRPSA